MDYTGESLRNAIKAQKFQIAEQLIAFGANVHEKNAFGQTALQFAVTNTSEIDRTDIIPNYFVYVEEELDCIASFHLAISARSEEMIKLAITGRKSNDYDTISARRLSLVKTLLSAGADVNSKDQNGCSPIQCAVYTGDLELVRALIDAGADIENRNRIGATALYDAILHCNLEMVKLLLSRGARVDDRAVSGETPLHLAAMINRNNSHSAIIEELLKYPVDVNSKLAGQTPFHYIVSHADFDMLRRFVELKADLKKVDDIGRTCLHFAAYNEDKDVLNFVIERSGMEIDGKCDISRCTALHLASVSCRPDNIRSLVAWGADVNAKAIGGVTPLFLCVKYAIPSILRLNFAEERRQAIRLLLESGSDVNAKASVKEEQLVYETTVLEEAINRGDVEAISLIVEDVVAIEARTSRPVFDDYNLEVIGRNSDIRSHYENCWTEMTAMRNFTIENTLVTHFSLFTESVDVLARYARNKDVVEDFERIEYYIASAYPIYGSRLRAKFDEAMVRRNLFENVCNILSTTLQFADPSHVCFEIIFKYLSPADIELLVDSA